MTGGITQLAMRTYFGQRSSQIARFASENGNASAETGQRDVA